MRVNAEDSAALDYCKYTALRSAFRQFVKDQIFSSSTVAQKSLFRLYRAARRIQKLINAALVSFTCFLTYCKTVYKMQ